MNILVYPKYSNPYQDLLRASIRQRYGSTTRVSYCRRLPLVGPIFFPLQIFVQRLKGYKLIHIHWPNFNLTLPIPFQKQISFWLFIICVFSLKALGYKIIWTVHNVRPHEAETINDTRTAQYLSQKADAKIVHSRFTIQQMKKLGLNTEQATIIPHGNYIDVYPDNINTESARQKLGIAKDEVVILFFGMIRPYKGVDELLNMFLSLHIQKTRLVIAGRCPDDALRQKIIAAQRNHEIDFYDGHVDDSDVATYFKACNVVCLPFQAITTSGSALLALSFGKPIIAPRAGALQDLPTTVGYLYDTKQKDALEKSLRQAVIDKVKLKKLGKSARAYAETLSWDKFAEQTYGVYEAVLRAPTKDSK